MIGAVRRPVLPFCRRFGNTTLNRLTNTLMKRTLFLMGSNKDGRSLGAYSYHSNQDNLSHHTNSSFNYSMSKEDLESNFKQICELIEDITNNKSHKNNIFHLKLSSIGNYLSLAMISEILVKSDNLRINFMSDIIEGLPKNTSLITRNRVQNSLSHIFLEVEFDDPEMWLWMIDLKKHHGIDFSRLLYNEQVLAECFKTRHNSGCSFDKFLINSKSKQVDFAKEPVFIDVNNLLKRLDKLLNLGCSGNFKFILGGDNLIHPITRRIALEAMRIYNKTTPQVFIEYSTHSDKSYPNIMRDIEFCVRDNICYGLQLTHKNSPIKSSILNFPLLNMSNFTELMNEMLIKYREDSLGQTEILIYTQNEIVVKYAMETMRIMQVDPESGLICFARQRDFSKKIARQMKKSNYPTILYELLGDPEAIVSHEKEFDEQNTLV